MALHVLIYCREISHHAFLTVREKMAQAYDFALDKIGMEIMSYQVCKSEQKYSNPRDEFLLIAIT